MNKITITFLFVSFVSAFSFSAPDFEDKNPNEIVIAFEKLSEKQLIYFNQLLTEIPGIKNTGFCERMKVYVFTYDSAVYRTEEDAVNAINIHTKKFIPIQKVVDNTQELLNNCK